MRRIDGTNRDVDAFGSGKDGYATSPPYTVLTPNAMNAIQEEIARAIEGFGVTLDGGNFAQLLQVMKAENRQGITELNASIQIIGSEADAHDHPSSASNIWKLFLRCLLPDGSWGRLYFGDGTAGDWAMTVNAEWAPASGSQTWSQDQGGLQSTILYAVDGELRWRGKAAGAGAWANSAWDDTRGSLHVGMNITAGTGDIVAGDDVVAGGDLVATGNAIAADFVYATGGPVTAISVSVFDGAGYLAAAHPTEAGIRIDPGGHWVVPVQIRQGATLGEIRIKVWQAFGLASTGYSVAVTETTTSNASSGGTNLDSDTGSTTPASTVTATIDAGDVSISRHNTYTIRIDNTGLTDGMNATWIEYDIVNATGPLNY